MVTSTVPTTVNGGRHHGMPFAPTNGVAARQLVETQIVEARERQAEAARDSKRYQRTSGSKAWGRS